MPSIYYLISLPIFLSSDSLSFHMPFFPLTYSALSVSSDPSFFLSTLLLFFPLPNRFIPFPFAPIFLHPLLFLLLFLYLLPATLFRTPLPVHSSFPLIATFLSPFFVSFVLSSLISRLPSFLFYLFLRTPFPMPTLQIPSILSLSRSPHSQFPPCPLPPLILNSHALFPYFLVLPNSHTPLPYFIPCSSPFPISSR